MTDYLGQEDHISFNFFLIAFVLSSCLYLLTLFGLHLFCLVAFDEDFQAEVAENYDARAEVSMLSKSLDPELTDVSD